MAVKRVINSSGAPSPVAAYSQATTDGNLVFTAGQIALTADDEFRGDEDIGEQTRQALNNIKRLLEEEGLTLRDVLKTTVYLSDIEDYDAMNEAYLEYFDDEMPARSALAVEALPMDADVEIEAVAASG